MVKLVCLTLAFVAAGWAQLVDLPRESQRQEVIQTVGLSTIRIVYHRPNVKGRRIWGELVPYGKVWRAGANEATLFEFTTDVTISGQALPAGKYSFHVIPNPRVWTLIFNKDHEQWGSFLYDPAKDALRVEASVAKGPFRESLSYCFEGHSANAVDLLVGWENSQVTFKIGVGDVHARVLTKIREAISTVEGGKKAQLLNQFALYVSKFKLIEYVPEALTKIDASIEVGETWSNLTIKAKLLAEQGTYADAVVVGEKAIATGRATSVNPNAIVDFQKTIAEWKQKSN
jgi:hypothetical protein